jgi:hypothetical protein
MTGKGSYTYKIGSGSLKEKQSAREPANEYVRQRTMKESNLDSK